MNSQTRHNHFVKEISDRPYYRIFATPEESNHNDVSTEDTRILNILFDPPKRRAGFGVTGLWEKEVYQFEDGVKGFNIAGGDIMLLKNGYFEVICPINIQFQRGWDSPQFAIPKSVKWLYPYVVIEFPVSFLRLVKAVYDESGINSDVNIHQYYHNITGYALPEGPPTYPAFGAFLDERGVYEGTSPIHSICPAEYNFNPDQVAFGLVRDVYAKFGITDARVIPAFDENGNFILE